jgi:hypothetical protein
MATAITFTLGTNVLTLTSGITYPVRAPREQVQAIDRTAAGALEVESLGTLIKRLTLGLRNQSAADYGALVNWFDIIAAGAANSFTYTDPAGADHVVRWTNGFNFTEGKAGWSGSIELEVVG